jgi:hypothetical protein
MTYGTPTQDCAVKVLGIQPAIPYAAEYRDISLPTIIRAAAVVYGARRKTGSAVNLAFLFM